MAARRCGNCGRDVHGLPDARQAGKLWFCSQSCYLQQESRLPSVSGSPSSGAVRAAPIAAGAGGARPLRAAWKTIKVVLTTVVLIVVALVIVAFVAFAKAAHDLNKSLSNLEKPATISAQQFRHVKTGMTRSKVRTMLGKPSDYDRKGEGIGGERCWYYGSIFSAGKSYAVCFKHNKVSDKFRME